MENFIKGQVASGFYGDATEVISDAIRRMQADEIRIRASRAASQLVDEELDRGDGVSDTTKTPNDITEAAINGVHSNSPQDPEPVCYFGSISACAVFMGRNRLSGRLTSGMNWCLL